MNRVATLRCGRRLTAKENRRGRAASGHEKWMANAWLTRGIKFRPTNWTVLPRGHPNYKV
jgi:hypothetical protein